MGDSKSLKKRRSKIGMKKAATKKRSAISAAKNHRQEFERLLDDAILGVKKK